MFCHSASYFQHISNNSPRYLFKNKFDNRMIKRLSRDFFHIGRLQRAAPLRTDIDAQARYFARSISPGVSPYTLSPSPSCPNKDHVAHSSPLEAREHNYFSLMETYIRRYVWAIDHGVNRSTFAEDMSRKRSRTLTVQKFVCLYSVVQKVSRKLLSISSANIDRFSNFFSPVHSVESENSQ